MQITLLFIGKTTDKNIQELITEYQNRLQHYTKFKLVVLEPNKKKLPQDEKELRKLEGELILAEVNPSTTFILLDEKGKGYTSRSFATYIQKQLNTGGKELMFCIGGAYGFDEKVYERADGKIALSAMTFTHQMVRLIFVEQIYRAFTILRGEKYHH